MQIDLYDTCVCIYVYVCVCVCMYRYTYRHTYTHAYMHTYMQYARTVVIECDGQPAAEVLEVMPPYLDSDS